MQKFRKIGILSSGGDAPGMNAAIRAVTRRALSQGIEVVGILGGYAGLLGAADESDPEVIREKHLRPLDAHSVSNIVTRGGTILYSSRCPEFKTEAGMAKALRVCHEQSIDAIIAIGGDGTFRGATDLTNHGIPSIGVYVAEEQQPDGTYRPVIDSVTENFGAEAAGLLRGDVILSADGTAVYSNYDLLRARRAHIVGETITLTVQRDGQTLDVEVYLYPVVEE